MKVSAFAAVEFYPMPMPAASDDNRRVRAAGTPSLLALAVAAGLWLL